MTAETTGPQLPKRSPEWFRDIEKTNHMTKAEAALWYARAGLAVFPCNERKEPLTRNGYKDATDDEAAVAAWWDANPDANIGVSMEGSGLYAVDVDMYAGGVWVPPTGEETLRAVTASSGIHHVYRRGVDQRGDLPGKAADHVDVKDKGYILVAPSVARSKADGELRGYWWDQCRPPAVSGPVFGQLTSLRSGAAPGLDGAVGGEGVVWAKEVAAAKKLREGEQRDALRRLCASLRASGWSDRQALPMLYLFVSNLVNYRAVDPWLPSHADKMWADTKANQKFDPQPLPEVDPDVAAWVASAAAGDGETVADAEVPERGENLLGFVDWSDPGFWNPPPARYFIPGMLVEGQVGTIYSGGGVGKSLLAQDVAFGLTARGTVFGEAVEPAPVLYIDRENSRRGLAKRMVSMGGSPASPPRDFHYSLLGQWPPLDTAAGGAALLAAVEKTGARLVVLDTMSKMVDGEENANDTWNGLHSHSMVRLKQMGVTVLQLDHTGKDADKGQRGGSSKQNNADVIWRLTKVGDRHVTLVCEKDRDDEYPVKLHLERLEFPFRHAVVEEIPAAAAAEERKRQEVELLVRLLDDKGVPADWGKPRIAKRLKDDGVSYSSDALTEAVRKRKETA